MENIEITSELQAVINFLNSGKNAFITGRAGTGKSTLIKHWMYQTNKQVILLAPTALAAGNINGSTIHSFFGFPPRLVQPTEINLWKSAKRRQAVKEVLLMKLRWYHQ